jgi:hypothetical protein
MLKSNDILIYFILAIVIFVCLKIYYESDAFNLKCIISEIDGQKYCVRERSKLELAADLLAKVTKKCKDLVEYVGKNHPDNEAVHRLVQKLIHKLYQKHYLQVNIQHIVKTKVKKSLFV